MLERAERERERERDRGRKFLKKTLNGRKLFFNLQSSTPFADLGRSIHDIVSDA